MKTREEEVAHALVHGHRIHLLLSPSLLNLTTRQSADERLVKADCGSNVEDETKVERLLFLKGFFELGMYIAFGVTYF